MKNKKDFQLLFPDGEFTHSQLARHNGKTNQQVWTRYESALKTGAILRVGTRLGKGKGKQPFIHRVNSQFLSVIRRPMMALVKVS